MKLCSLQCSPIFLSNQMAKRSPFAASLVEIYHTPPLWDRGPCLCLKKAEFCKFDLTIPQMEVFWLLYWTKTFPRWGEAGFIFKSVNFLSVTVLCATDSLIWLGSPLGYNNLSVTLPVHAWWVRPMAAFESFTTGYQWGTLLGIQNFATNVALSVPKSQIMSNNFGKNIRKKLVGHILIIGLIAVVRHDKVMRVHRFCSRVLVCLLCTFPSKIFMFR